MPKMTLQPSLQPNAGAVTIQMNMDGEALGHIHLEAAELEGFIHTLAMLRSQMKEAVPPQLDAGSRLECYITDAWRVPQDVNGIRTLALRHPGLGWLGFGMPPEMAKQIAEWLAKDTIP
ncbi:hypothetical protein [Tabrizicola sp. M-4]|uniref:hypothetical protein n=1 Tax=Tabrizicola sp. M-4 TaxID=3055847 RepID=UPI003DAA178D